MLLGNIIFPMEAKMPRGATPSYAMRDWLWVHHFEKGEGLSVEKRKRCQGLLEDVNSVCLLYTGDHRNEPWVTQ